MLLSHDYFQIEEINSLKNLKKTFFQRNGRQIRKICHSKQHIYIETDTQLQKIIQSQNNIILYLETDSPSNPNDWRIGCTIFEHFLFTFHI